MQPSSTPTDSLQDTLASLLSELPNLAEAMRRHASELAIYNESMHGRKETLLFQKEILTLQEAALYLGRSESDLYKLTGNRSIAHSKPGGKLVYFQRKDLDEWMLSNPVKTRAELHADAAAYLAARRQAKLATEENRPSREPSTRRSSRVEETPRTARERIRRRNESC